MKYKQKPPYKNYQWFRDILIYSLGCTFVFIIFGLCDNIFFAVIYNNLQFQKQLIKHGITLTSFAILVGGIATSLGLIMGRLIEILLQNIILSTQTRTVHKTPNLLFQICGILISAFLYMIVSRHIPRLGG